MSGPSEHLAGSRYETLIKKAFNCGEGDKHGARRGYFINLYRAERGESSGLLGGSFEDQFDEIKENIRAALIEFDSNPSFEMKELISEIDNCENTDCLSAVVKRALDNVK
ncbi:MAG: hypothetical protein ABGW97_03090 [Christiangramia sp.]|uniref:hypothetical protein n=1 Tax=Christiangramia sp. TaxID=1931228 RepID=UPI003242F2A6